MDFIDEKFIVAVATIIFCILTFKPIKKAIIGMLDERIRKISKDLDEASRLKTEAEKLFKDAQSKLEQSEVEGTNILAHARTEAERIIFDAKMKLEKDIDIRRKLAMQKIQSYEDNAIDELKKNISNITIAAAAQVIEQNGDDETFKRLVVDSIDKFYKTLH